MAGMCTCVRLLVRVIPCVRAVLCSRFEVSACVRNCGKAKWKVELQAFAQLFSSSAYSKARRNADTTFMLCGISANACSNARTR